VEDILLFNKFFPTVDTRLSCEDIAQSFAMVRIWRFFASCISASRFIAAHFRHAF